MVVLQDFRSGLALRAVPTGFEPATSGLTGRRELQLHHGTKLEDQIDLCTPNGIRTRAATLKGWCPRPLDDGGIGRLRLRAPQHYQSSGKTTQPIRGVLARGTVPTVRLDLDPSLHVDDYPYHHTLRVRFAETDAMGIVHHSRYLPYLEEARVEYLRALDHPYQRVHPTGDRPGQCANHRARRGPGCRTTADRGSACDRQLTLDSRLGYGTMAGTRIRKPNAHGAGAVGRAGRA